MGHVSMPPASEIQACLEFDAARVLALAEFRAGAAVEEKRTQPELYVGEPGIEQFGSNRSAAIVGVGDDRQRGREVEDVERLLLAYAQIEVIR